jgi:L-alanine-DL-glutamate epimerase-like enolase superfamily enzyme
MYTVATNQVHEIAERVAEAPLTDLFKFKLTGTNDAVLLKEMITYADRPLFIDANQGWSGMENWIELESLISGVELAGIEQPFPVGQEHRAKELVEHSGIPVFADESFEGLEHLPEVAANYSGINIKLMKCGGIRNALRIIEPARKAGLRIMLGSMSETTCGTAASMQLAGLVELLDQDGPWLLANDPFRDVGGVGLGIQRI